MSKIIIETPRLHICPMNASYGDEIQLAKEQVWPELQMWMSWAHHDMKPRSAIDAYIASLSPDNPWDAAVAFSRDDGRFTAMGGLHTGREAGDFSTGYWCARDKQGNGYATEMTNALIRYGFDSLGTKQVRISYYEGNAPSRRIIDKLGFTYTHTVKDGHKRCLDGTPLDVHHFVMTDPSVLPPLEWRIIRKD